MKDKLNPFHLAIPVSNLEESVAYYRDTLGLKEGRSSSKWADFNFFGHQLVCHVSDYINNEYVINTSDITYFKNKNIIKSKNSATLEDNFKNKFVANNFTFLVIDKIFKSKILKKLKVKSQLL